jgi:hypothetical protein
MYDCKVREEARGKRPLKRPFTTPGTAGFYRLASFLQT